MSQRASGYDRQPNDAYETPAWVTQVMVPYLRQYCTCLWDPANGPGSRLAQALRDEGFRAVATNDDFLSMTSLPDSRIDGICSNPPYGKGGRLACQFIAHAIELAPVVAMLLRIDFDSGKRPAPSCSATAGPLPERSCCWIGSLGSSGKTRKGHPTIMPGTSGTGSIGDRR
jgi:hypothetical protein